jgi:hypothetical protein
MFQSPIGPTAFGSTFHVLPGSKAIRNIEGATRPLPPGLARSSGYPIDTSETEGNAATALRMTIALDLGISAALARGSQARGFESRERVRDDGWGPRHNYCGKAGLPAITCNAVGKTPKDGAAGGCYFVSATNRTSFGPVGRFLPEIVETQLEWCRINSCFLFRT